MSRFGHLRNVENGAKDATVSVTLYGYTPPRQRGWLDPGRYAMDITDAEWRGASSGAGVNLHVTLRSALPAEMAGVSIDDWIYIPFDDGEMTPKMAQLSDIAFNKLQHVMRSIASATPGKVEGLQVVGTDGKPKFAAMGPASIINKRCFAEVEPGESDVIGNDGRTRDFSDSSKVRYYIGREDFEALPGASKAAPKSAATQKGTPEIGAAKEAPSGNGARAGAVKPNQAAIQDLVDF